MHSRKLSFDNGRGHKLAAILDQPVDDAPIAWALFAHCFTCSKDYKGVARVSRALGATRRPGFTGPTSRPPEPRAVLERPPPCPSGLSEELVLPSCRHTRGVGGAFGLVWP